MVRKGGGQAELQSEEWRVCLAGGAGAWGAPLLPGAGTAGATWGGQCPLPTSSSPRVFMSASQNLWGLGNWLS